MTSWTDADVPDQTGRLAVVTGANSGLGLEVARVLAARGARVVLACRNPGGADAAAGSFCGELPAALVDVRQLDLADLASVRRLRRRPRGRARPARPAREQRGPDGGRRGTTADGFELQLGVNHLGHFALTARLLAAAHPHARQPGRDDVEHGTRPRPAAPRRPHVHPPRIRALAAILRQQAGQPALHPRPAAPARRGRRTDDRRRRRTPAPRAPTWARGHGPVEPGDALRRAGADAERPPRRAADAAGRHRPRRPRRGVLRAAASWRPARRGSRRRRPAAATPNSPRACGRPPRTSPAYRRGSQLHIEGGRPSDELEDRRVPGLHRAEDGVERGRQQRAQVERVGDHEVDGDDEPLVEDGRLDEVQRARDRVRGLQPQQLVARARRRRSSTGRRPASAAARCPCSARTAADPAPGRRRRRPRRRRAGSPRRAARRAPGPAAGARPPGGGKDGSEVGSVTLPP